MGNTDSASRTLKGSVTGWPNLSWVTSYAGADKLSPDPSRALLDGVRERDDAVVITAREGERKFTAGVSVADPVLRRGIVISLRKAVGRTLNDVGGMEIVSRP